MTRIIATDILLTCNMIALLEYVRTCIDLYMSPRRIVTLEIIIAVLFSKTLYNDKKYEDVFVDKKKIN